MPATNVQYIEQLKGDGEYFLAGFTASWLGLDADYGYHYGMPSSRDGAVAAFKRGHLVAPGIKANEAL